MFRTPLSRFVAASLSVWAPTVLAQVTFTEIASDANVQMTHQLAPNLTPGLGFFFAGGAVGDFNNDGWEDMFVIDGGNFPDRLYINQRDGTFVDKAADWGLADVHMGVGASVGDFNNDGWLDIFVTSYGPAEGAMSTGQNRLYRNEQGTGFTEIAESAGVHWNDAVPNAFGAAFGDYDLDGDLDLFVTGWDTSASSVGGNRLFRNNGNETFTDVTEAAGLLELGVHGFAVRFADMNGDRYPEILLVADFKTSRYFANNTDGTFADLTGESGTSLECNGMGGTIGDFNNDGLMDLYVTDRFRDSVPEEPCHNMLYINQGGHEYLEVAQSAGVDDGRWGWGTTALDIDHDGWLDLVEVNGAFDSDLAPITWSQQPERMYMNAGDLTFQDTASTSGFEHDGQARGVLNFDFDNDGDQDVVIFSFHEPLAFFRNDTLTGNNWIRFFLDTSGNDALAPNGFGTRIQIMCGANRYVRYIDGGSNYLSQSELSAHFGIGSAASVDEIRVQWANGLQSILSDVATNQTLTIVSPTAPALGDCDADGSVSSTDHACFVDCLLGQGGGVANGCEAFDFEQDGDIDLADWARFTQTFTGTIE